MKGIGNRFLYILRNVSDRARHYVGTASDVDQRLDWHNAGPSGYAVRYRPWSLLVTRCIPASIGWKRRVGSKPYS
jgi:predicted GIY-YIG superfamily endonuclease